MQEQKRQRIYDGEENLILQMQNNEFRKKIAMLSEDNEKVGEGRAKIKF